MSSWTRAGKSAQVLAAHALLFSFTLLLALKLDQRLPCSWWLVFAPLLLFHTTTARGRFSLPAPSSHHDCHWAPCHAIVATPLLVAFELLLCIYLETTYVNDDPAVDLKIVFLPLLAFEVTIFADNFRMCTALMPRDGERMDDEAIWEALPHFWVAISMVFLVAATTFTLLKLCGHVDSLGWWDLFINFGIAECFAFLVCTRWSNPLIHQQPRYSEPGLSSTAIRHHELNNSMVISSADDQIQGQSCDLQALGGHIMKIPFITFQFLLCMRLEGTPPAARNIPILALFSPLFLLQGVAVLFATSRFIENFVLLVHGSIAGRYSTISFRAHDCFAFLHQGSRVLGWWSIDEGSREEQARLFHAGSTGYDTFCGCPPEVVKKMPKEDLAQQISRLQAALRKQAEITSSRQQEYERLHNEKVLCRICFEGEICIVLLPCRHRTLCKVCADKCKRCPICRASVELRMLVYDV